MVGKDTPPLGDLLRALREAAGLTQEELAERARLSRDAISALERGRRRRPYPPTLAAIADALGLSSADRDALRRSARTPVPEPSPPAADPAPVAGVPDVLTDLIGRAREIADLTELLTPGEGRLVTITGPGGVGKTRLSIELLRLLEPHYCGRVAFVPLGVVADSSFVLATIAQALGVQNPGGVALAGQIAEVLGEEPFLLVLDNLEHLPDAAPMISELVRAWPGLTVLVTSRARLRLSLEREFPLHPFTTNGQASAQDAVDLFVQRAQRVRPDFKLTSRNRQAVRSICQRLDGLPLAIELAAARVNVLPPEALLARLDSGIELLSGGPRDQHHRLQSVRAAIAWSYDLLGQSEQVVFRALSVFVGEFSLEAAERVLGAALGMDPIEVLEAIASLIDKSLIWTARTERSEPHFSMLFTIRSFGAAELDGSPESVAVRRAHAEYILGVAEEAAEVFRHITGTDQLPWFAVLERERGNWRAALSWLHEHGDTAAMLRLTTALAWFWYVQGPIQEGHFWLERAVAMPTEGVPPNLRPRALVGKGLLDVFLGRLEDARASLNESLKTAPDPGEPWWVASADLFLGMVGLAEGEYAIAEQYLLRSIEGYRVIRHPINETIALGLLAAAAWGRGESERALAICRETEAIQRPIDDLWGLAVTLGYHALIASELGDTADASRALQENLEIRRQAVMARAAGDTLEAGEVRWQAGVWDDVATSLAVLGVLATDRGEAAAGARWFGAAAAIRRHIGDRAANLPERDVFAAAEARARDVLGASEFALRYEEGESLSGNQALHYAIATADRLVAESS